MEVTETIFERCAIALNGGTEIQFRGGTFDLKARSRASATRTSSRTMRVRSTTSTRYATRSSG